METEKHTVKNAAINTGKNGNLENLSIRDWFAGQALIGITIRNREGDNIITASYEIADAMIKERKK